jgi:hypothetical protein
MTTEPSFDVYQLPEEQEAIREAVRAIAAQAVGIAQGALDYARAYVRERKQFGSRWPSSRGSSSCSPTWG